MRQLSSLDAQFLHVESPTTIGHVGSLVVVDPGSAPGGIWDVDSVRDLLEARLHVAPLLRQRLVEVPLGLGRPYWVDDPHFDLEFHLRELALPAPGTRSQLAEQVARIHARQLDRSRPLWEAYVITGLEDGRAAFYAKIHHAAIDGVSGSEILEAVLHPDADPLDGAPPAEPFVPRPMPSGVELLRRGLGSLSSDPLQVVRSLPRSLSYLDQLPGAANVPGVRLVSEAAAVVGRALGQPVSDLDARDLRVPRTPFNGPITAHRRFAFGSLPLADVKRVKEHYGMTVNDVVLALVAATLRRWLLDHDALPSLPLVAAIPVSVRADSIAPDSATPIDPDGVDADGEGKLVGNQVSVMVAALPTDVPDPVARAAATRASMLEAKQHFDTIPATLLQDLSDAIPTALSGLAARALFRLATLPGVPFNLFVSNIPGPTVPLYVAGARVDAIYPISGVSDMTGGLNITLFSYDGHLDFGFIACREMVPDLWVMVDYLDAALDELLATLP